MAQETELEFLEDANALISEALETGSDPVLALKALADEIRERIAALEAEAGK